MAQAKKGRPKKVVEEAPVANEMEEERKVVNMSQNTKVTSDAITQRWQQLFHKYSRSSYDDFVGAWNAGVSMLNNPFLQNYRIKQSVAKPLKAQQEELQQALASPENSELTLTRISMWLYYTNYVYNLLIKLNRDTPMFNYYYSPLYTTEKDMKTDAFRLESQKVDKILREFKPKSTLKTITTQVSLEGKSSYVPRISYDKNDINFFVMQKLNTDMVKLTGFGSKQRFKASFNMIIFLQQAYDVNQYPKFIRDTWQQMNDGGLITKDKKGNAKFNPQAALRNSNINGILEYTEDYYMYWVELPQDLCYTFYSDGAHPNMLPDTIGLFNDLNELDDYRWLQANLLSKGVNSVLTAEVPIVRDPKAGSDATVITPDTILGYQDIFSSSVSSNILAFFAPFKEFELHSIDSQPEALDIIYDRTRDLIATSGNSALLSITDKPSIASVKAAQAIQAARIDYLTRQYEDFLNEVINSSFGLKYTWKVSLWGDIFSIRDDQKNIKEAVLNGALGLIPKLLSAHGYTTEEYIASEAYVKALDIKLEMVTSARINENRSSNSSSSSVTGKSTGRTAIEETEITNDSTAASRDQGTNVSEIKEFSEEELQERIEDIVNSL